MLHLLNEQNLPRQQSEFEKQEPDTLHSDSDGRGVLDGLGDRVGVHVGLEVIDGFGALDRLTVGALDGLGVTDRFGFFTIVQRKPFAAFLFLTVLHFTTWHRLADIMQSLLALNFDTFPVRHLFVHFDPCRTVAGIREVN